MKKYHIEGDFAVDGNGNVRSGKYVIAGLLDAARFIERYGTEIKEPVTYRVGDRLKHNESGMEYMLVCTEIDGPHEYGVTVHLVSMDTGNSVVEFCPRNHMEILPSEFNIEGLDELTKIEDTNG